MVGAVLALGDVDFVERSEAKDGDPLTDLVEASRPRLDAAARLLDVSPDAILSALISRKINAGISSQVGCMFSLGTSVPRFQTRWAKIVRGLGMPSLSCPANAGLFTVFLRLMERFFSCFLTAQPLHCTRKLP